MNLFKRTTASVALVALVSGIFSTGVSAASTSEIEAANMLASKGIINTQSDVANYNLEQNVLRQEIAKVAANMAGIEAKTSCDDSFADVSATTPNTWACSYAEALLDAGKISANANFRPEANISKSEAVKMVLDAAGYTGFYSDAAMWQSQTVAFAADKGIVNSFTNYDTPATRGFIFEAAHQAINSTEEVVEECDEVSQLLGLCGEEMTEETTEEETTEETVVVSSDNVLMAELSAMTPAGSDLPSNATGVAVLSFDVTAGSEDVSITGIELERTGFGEAAADEVAIYTEEGRASKVKSFNDSDDIANLTFSPAVVVKAGETRTMTAKVNVASSGEFQVSVANITASSTVEAATIISDTFEAISGVSAANLEFDFQGVNVSVKAGEEQAELAEFKLENKGTASTSVDVDVYVSSVTLEQEGSIDEDMLENLTLTLDGNVISTVSMMNDKYVTFTFDPVLIADDRNETFTVKADLMGGADEDVSFALDDVVDVTATASKYNAVKVTIASSDIAETVAVEAGELTIYSIDATADEIREDKDNVVLGQVKVVNVAGKNLELQNFGIEITTTNSGVIEVLENVEVEVNGTSYDLDDSATGTGDLDVVYSENDLGINLPQGTTILTVRADTLDNLTDGTEVSFTLNADDTVQFLVEETEEDVKVTDVIPGFLSFDKVTVIDTAAQLSNVPLANVSVVKGSADIVALQFEIEAGEASYVTVDEIKALLQSGSTDAITKDEVSEVALYKGSVSESNLLDKISGSKLDASGFATFDGFEVEVAADATETFVITLSTVDTDTVVDTVITTTVAATNVMLEDDENDPVTLGGESTVGSKEITVLDSGNLALSADENNADNEFSKTVLAGEEVVAYSIDAKAKNEEVSAEIVEFTLNADLKEVVATAKLWLGDSVVATATNSDVTTLASGSSYGSGDTLASTGTSIMFDNISNLEFPTTTTELRLSIVTENIGYEQIGESVNSVEVLYVSVDDAQGVESGEDVEGAALVVPTAGNTGSNTFDVVSTTVVASASNTFGVSDNTATLTFAVDSGNNTDSNGSNLSATLSGVSIEVTSFSTGGTLTLTNNNSDTVAIINITNNGIVTLVAGKNNGGAISGYSSEVISNGEVYTIETTAEANFKLVKDGVEYSDENGSYSMNLQANEVLGQYTK